MRAATQVVNKNPATIITMDIASCQPGTPNGMRTIMATGAVNGMIDSHTANVLSGLFMRNENDRI